MVQKYVENKKKETVKLLFIGCFIHLFGLFLIVVVFTSDVLFIYFLIFICLRESAHEQREGQTPHRGGGLMLGAPSQDPEIMT